MESKIFTAGQAPCSVQGVLTLCGKEISLNIVGGILPHIGAVAVAEPRASLKGDGSRSASCSVLCMLGHKDDMLAREAALRLATVTDSRTVVTVGLHVDNIDQDKINILTDNFRVIIQDCLKYLK